MPLKVIQSLIEVDINRKPVYATSY